MSRYRHEPGTGESPAEATCWHCGGELSDLEGGLLGFCESRQRRHDAFVAAALTGLITVAGSTIMVVGISGAATGKEFTPDDAGAIASEVRTGAAADAVLIADTVMAELAKAAP